MNDPDSILDPVARRISYTGSCPSARSSAQLGSVHADDVAGGSHCANVLADWTMTWHANCACWRHSYIMMTSSWASLLCMMTSQLCHADIITIRVRHVGRVVWYLGRVSPSRRRWRVARVCARGARLCAWPTTLPARDGAGGHLWRPISLLFSPVASSLPPLHSGMVKTQFWQLFFF